MDLLAAVLIILAILTGIVVVSAFGIGIWIILERGQMLANMARIESENKVYVQRFNDASEAMSGLQGFIKNNFENIDKQLGAAATQIQMLHNAQVEITKKMAALDDEEEIDPNIVMN